MKNAIIIMLMMMPVISFSQSKKEGWYKRKRQEMRESYSKTPIIFNSPLDEAGFHPKMGWIIFNWWCGC